MSTIRDRISEIIGVSNTEAWQIVDSKTSEGLYLLHYSPEANLDKYGFIRGLVVDVPNRLIVAKSFGFSPRVQAQVIVPNERNIVSLEDKLNPGIEYEIDLEKAKFYPGFEGVLVRVFIHNDIIYYSTHRRLEAGEKLTNLYKSLNGPKREYLFGEERNSPYVYMFVISDPSLQVASKTIYKTGYIVYLGFEKMSETNSKPLYQGSNTVVPNTLNLEEINEYLSSGSYVDDENSDPRLKPGEFVFAYLFDSKGETQDNIKIESPAYQWRRSLIDNNPDLYHQFFLLANGKFLRAETPEERQVYMKKFLVLYPYEEEELKELVPLINWPGKNLREQEIDDILVDPEKRLYNIYINFIFVLPLEKQKNVLNFYSRYRDDLKKVTEKLIKIERDNEVFGPEISSRVKQILYLARYTARKILDKGSEEDLDVLIGEAIIELVKREEGNSLYQIIRLEVSKS